MKLNKKFLIQLPLLAVLYPIVFLAFIYINVFGPFALLIIPIIWLIAFCLFFKNNKQKSKIILISLFVMSLIFGVIIAITISISYNVTGWDVMEYTAIAMLCCIILASYIIAIFIILFKSKDNR